jgi:thymidylate synthase (FAD)
MTLKLCTYASSAMEYTFSSDIPVKFIEGHGNDDSVIRAMLVSTIGGALSGEDDFLAEVGTEKYEKSKNGRINFLVKNRHGSPFEHNSMTFYVKAPIFVFREWHRHRIGFSYNEESGRYTQLKPEFYIPSPDRNLIQIGKTGAYEFVPGSEEQYDEMSIGHQLVCKRSYENYERQLEKGIAKEVARMTLPVNIFSSMYVTLNARSLMAFLSLRTIHEASMFPSFPMREIAMAGEQLEEVFAERFPITHAAFNNNGRVGP